MRQEIVRGDKRTVAVVLNTQDVLTVTHSVIGCCARIAEVARARLGADVALLLTGGDASWAQPLLPFASRIEPDLVLRGLAVIADV